MSQSKFYKVVVSLVLLILPIIAGAQLAFADTITTIAGNGNWEFSGDGGLATAAGLDLPMGLAKDSQGNIYITERYGNRIRKINTSGIISTIAGTGIPGFSGDGGAATAAQIDSPHGIAVDSAGNVFFSQVNGSRRVRKINTSGIISTIAGTGAADYNGDGISAISANVSAAKIAFDSSGNLYLTDIGRIRKINTSGIISTVAGTGTVGFSGDGGLATAAQISPLGVGVDSAGNIYIADSGNNRVRKVNTAGIINTIAGTGTAGYSGDGGPATAAQLNNPYDVQIDSAGNLYITDNANHRIRKVNTSGIITTFAGNGIAGFAGDGGEATAAQLNTPGSTLPDSAGSILIADTWNYRIRKVTIPASSNLQLPTNAQSSGNSKVSIPLTLNNPTGAGIEGIDLTVSFNSSVLKATGAVLTGGVLENKGYSITPNTQVSGQITLSIFAAGSLFTGSGVIAYLQFDVLGSVGATTPLTFTVSKINAVSSGKTDGVFTVTGAVLSGHVGYYPKPSSNNIPRARVNLTGAASLSGDTDSAGNYSITVNPVGTYTAKASKSDDLGGVSATDASDISRYVAGLISLNCYQKIAADTDMDGQITSVDASRAARYSVGLINCLNTSTSCVNWVFLPDVLSTCNFPPVSYTTEKQLNLSANLTQNFIGIRLGDVTGNWTAGTTTRSAREHIETRDNPTYTLTSNPGFMCKVPILLNQSSEIRGIDITLGFDNAFVSAADVTLSGGILDGKD